MKKVRLWLAAKGADLVAHMVIGLALVGVIYLLALIGFWCLWVPNLPVEALGVVVLALLFGLAVAAVQWVVIRE